MNNILSFDIKVLEIINTVGSKLINLYLKT